MKHLKLRALAFVDGKRQLPEDGVISCSDDEAARLIDAGLAEDVSDDFADSDADIPPETAPAAKAGKAK